MEDCVSRTVTANVANRSPGNTNSATTDVRPSSRISDVQIDVLHNYGMSTVNPKNEVLCV